MTSAFTYHVPTKLYFGPVAVEDLAKEISSCGKNVLLVYGSERLKGTAVYPQICDAVIGAGATLFEAGGVEPNPRITTVNRMAALCREKGIDVLLAAGGGSVIDCAKFVSAAAGYNGDAWDFFVGKARMETFLPLLTIPTLAGTGSDMDAFGIVSNEDTLEKIPLFHEGLFPRATFLAPSLTCTVSPYQTACGSIDALTHYLEVYLMRPNLRVLTLVMEGFMKAIVEALPRVMAKPDDLDARADLMWASSWALNGFTFGPTHGVPFACHWIEDELSAKYDMTHGLGLAIVLPHYLEYCLNERTAPLVQQFGVNVLGVPASFSPMDAAREAIARLRCLFFEVCGLTRSLSGCGITDERHFDEMAEVACRGGIIHALVDLAHDDIVAIYRRSM